MATNPNRTGATRVHYAGTVSNGDLVRLTVKAARMAARRMRWPRQLPREDAARLLWRYVKGRVKYRAEGPHEQTVRLPSATVKERRGDCKSSAVFIAAGAKAAGHRAALRFVKQGGGAYWSHVYALVDGVPVDPLLSFGSEVRHTDEKNIEL